MTPEEKRAALLNCLAQQIEESRMYPLSSTIGGTLTPQPDPRKSFGEWLYRIFRPCDHKWETFEQHTSKTRIPKSISAGLRQNPDELFQTHEWVDTATVYHMRCKSCGEIISRKVRA